MTQNQNIATNQNINSANAIDDDLIVTIFKQYTQGIYDSNNIDSNGDKTHYMPSLNQLSEMHSVDYNALIDIANQQHWEMKKKEFWHDVWNKHIKKTIEEHKTHSEKTAVLSKYKNKHGHFLKGNPGGPGRGNTNGNGKIVINKIRQRMFAMWSKHPEVFEEGMAKLMLKFADGDIDVQKFLLPYFLGKPDQNVFVNIDDNGNKNNGDINLSQLSDSELKNMVQSINIMKSHLSESDNNENNHKSENDSSENIIDAEVIE